MLSIFDHREIELVLCGLPNIDKADWQKNTLYAGMYESKGNKHKVIKWFWKLVDELDDTMAARLLQFSTGTATGNEQSWINSTMGLWMSNFSERDGQIRHWLNNDRPPHFSFRGFFNPQGFLTAMKQEVTRKHKSDGWALDDVIYHTEVTEYEKIESVSKGPREGIYASGLMIDGAAWSKPLGSLVESEPKKLFASLPVLYVTGTTKQLRREHIKSGAYGPNGPYDCPLYKYPVRTDRFFIGMVSLASRAQPAGASGAGSPPRDAPKKEHWILRGVALTCSVDFE